jgi:hypothetical protein
LPFLQPVEQQSRAFVHATLSAKQAPRQALVGMPVTGSQRPVLQSAGAVQVAPGGMPPGFMLPQFAPVHVLEPLLPPFAPPAVAEPAVPALEEPPVAAVVPPRPRLIPPEPALG